MKTHNGIGKYNSNGEPKRDNKGKYSKKGMSGFKKFSWTVLLLAIAFIAGGIFQPRAYAVPFEVDNLAPKIEDLKDKVVEELAQCESENASQDTALVNYDNNKKGTLTGRHIASIGVMQFKVQTVQSFYKTLHKENLTNYEATLLALDNNRAKELAKESVFGIQGALWHWSCATPDMGAKVTMIKNLSK